MALTRRGRTVTGLITLIVLLAGAVVAVSFLGGRSKGSPLDAPGSPSGSGDGSPVTSTTEPPPPVCPLSGLPAPKGVPDRPALAVKIENLPAARPQSGLASADIVYEEPVEGGITRFIAVYQCQDAKLIEPVRSARFTDADMLVQFGQPLFGYAGGVPKVTARVHQAGLLDVNYSTSVASAYYHRDPDRLAPHNLFTNTKDLYTAGERLTTAGPPAPVFVYTEGKVKGVRTTQVHLPFSSYSDVYWKWSSATKAWLRFHGDVPHASPDGTQFQATNVIVQIVKITLTDVTDVNGVASPEVVATGTGKAYVFRGGKVVVGTWSRPTLADVTKFYDANGKEIPLLAGNTWVELLPEGIPVTYS
jgi:hypothetical protein